LPPRPSMVAPPKKENLDMYCDYHGEKGHYTNDCYHLKRQLEAVLESGKLNHMVKDVRQRGSNRGRQSGNNNGRGKVINMVQEGDAEVECYLVRRVFMDKGAAVQVMFEHCFDNLSPAIKACLTLTQTELLGFSGEQLIPVGKVELEVKLEGGGLFHKTMLKFTVVRASSPYNIILGHTGMRELRVVSSTIHAMKVVKHDERIEVREPEGLEESREEKMLVNPAFPERTVTIGTPFSVECREWLTSLLKNNMDVFAWQPSDMVGVPRRVIKHALNVNVSVPPVAQKRRVLCTEKSRAVMKEVEKWVRARNCKAGEVSNVRSTNPHGASKKGLENSWRLCIDFSFKNLNLACPKDYYPLLEIDLKIEAVMGFPFKCFLDAYKGYHQSKCSKMTKKRRPSTLTREPIAT
ncbi:hypothetical protein Tco_0304189, partial [Tanacetum coccineum]